MNDVPPSAIHILCAADRAFLRHVPIMLASVRANSTKPLKVSIVSVDWRAEDQEKIRASTPGIDVNFLSLPREALQGLPHKAVLSPLSYARILMPDLVPDDRYLYLDIDMIVRADLSELWSVELGDAPAAAVFHGSALNAGMVLVNAKVWRERRLGAQILDWARLHQPKEADQAAIEAIIGSEMIALDPRWNRLVDPVWGRQPLKHPAHLEEAAILHFITGFKPWNLGRRLLPRAYADEWVKHVRPSGLPVDWRYEVKTLLWQLRILSRRAVRR